MLTDTLTYTNVTLLLGPERFRSNYKGVIEDANRILALDPTGRPIPHTFLGTIEHIAPALPTGIHALTQIEEGFLFYATPWHTNFQHFLTETFPKVVDYLELIRSLDRLVPLLVPDFLLNGFVEELLLLLGIRDCVTVLNSPAICRVGTLYSASYVPNYDPLPPKAVAAFQLLRDAAQETWAPEIPTLTRRIYLARDRAANVALNNSNAGARRIITNEAAIVDELSVHGFESVVMGNLRIAEKVQALAGAEVIASPIGANLMNLLFLTPPYPRRVIILHSAFLSVHAIYFRDLLERVYDGRIAVDLFDGPSETETENSPYTLDPKRFAEFLQCLFTLWGSRMAAPMPREVYE